MCDGKADGGEIGRAQALQALACGVEPLTDMNPILLKPETETGAQVVVQGKRVATVAARDYAKMKPGLMAPTLESFQRLGDAADLVLVEGAGSPAEVNLRAGDIANMGFARAAGVPVVQPKAGAFPELIEVTGGGLIYENLVDDLKALLLDPERVKELGAEGCNAVQQSFGVEMMAQNMISVYREVRQND